MFEKTMEYFAQLTTLPRPSKKEMKVREWLINRSKNQGYEYKQDTIGNIVVYVPATKEKENTETIILQAHMDMVCVKDLDSNHDFEVDPIQVINDGEWITANKTTLGTDNGIGLAMCLAATHIESHPRLELLFTVDEEQGMSGALQLDASMLTGKKFINLDTEDEGEVCISSAGGGRINAGYTIEKNTSTALSFQVTIDGMKGGHSGVDIDKNRGSAIIAMLELLTSYTGNIEVSSIDGGVADNAIPSNCSAVVSFESIEEFNAHVSVFLESLRKTFDCPDAFIEINKIPSHTIIKNGCDLCMGLLAIKQGVYAMSSKIPGLVQTSLNLGIIKTEENTLSLTYAPRSSVMSELDDIIQEVQTKHEQNGAIVTIKSRYPGWQENPSNTLVTELVKHYGEVLGYSPEIVAYHAGLECGAIVEKLGAGAQAVSFGPTIKDPHSTSERCLLSSVDKCCETLKSLLQSCNI